jgi:hypothetical protein
MAEKMNSTQQETINLLKKEAFSGIASASICTVLGIGLNIGIPFIFKSQGLTDKITNALNFTASFSLTTYALFKGITLKSTIGKIDMFRQLENELLANEQVLANEFQLALQQVQYEQQIMSLLPQQMPATMTCADASASNTSSNIDSNNIGTNLAVPGCASNSTSNTSNSTSNINEQDNCPHCGSSNIKKNGSSNGKQRYYCNECDSSFQS